MQTIEELENDIRKLREEIDCAEYEQRLLLQMDLAATRKKLELLKAASIHPSEISP